MKHAWILALLLVPGAFAQAPSPIEVGPEHVQQHITIPVGISGGGIGSSLIEGHFEIYIDYSQVIPDDDEKDSDNTTFYITINAYGPGLNVANFQIESTILYSTCDTWDIMHEEQGQENFLSWYSAMHRFNNTIADGLTEQCIAQLDIRNIGDSPFSTFVNVRALNSDGNQADATGFILLLVGGWGVYQLITARIRNPMLQVGAAIIGLGALLLPMPDTAFDVLLVGQAAAFLYYSFRLSGEFQ